MAHEGAADAAAAGAASAGVAKAITKKRKRHQVGKGQGKRTAFRKTGPGALRPEEGRVPHSVNDGTTASALDGANLMTRSQNMP